ncbi:MAG: acyl-CoA thioesterase, partial [bacterium]|nr:acyl-CoA thioesterase [bacterium]
QMEQRGVFLPLVQAHINYAGRARYDDELIVTTTASPEGRARIRFDVHITHAARSSEVANGYTIHAVVNANGKPIRPPTWLTDTLSQDQTA